MIENIGNIASVAGFFLGIIYGIGLFIVTIHLTRYGITSVYLVQARYLVVGFVYLVHVFGMIFFSAPAAIIVMFTVGLENSTYILLPVGLIALILLVLPSYSPKDFEKRMRRRYKSDLNAKKYWKFWHITMFCSLLVIWQSLAQTYYLGDTNSNFFSFSILGILLFASTVYYTIFLYQSPITVGNPVLELVGAGQPIRIRLAVNKDKISSFQEYGLFPSQEKLSNPLLLLDETNEEFLVLIKFEEVDRAVKINKSVVDSVIYLP